jgi:hypothetical protein
VGSEVERNQDSLCQGKVVLREQKRPEMVSGDSLSKGNSENLTLALSHKGELFFFFKMQQYTARMNTFMAKKT